MGILAENSQFFKGKIPIISEYSDQHRAMLSTIASRGFTSIPGFLFEASIGLETQAKIKISNLNYQITADAIERELKQTGHDYSQTYKAARIAFELDKQTLLTALRQEFSDLDAIQSLKEEELSRLFIELDLRRIILITTKTAIELEMEGLRQELIAVDRLTLTNEAALINEKVVTANAKLAVIPYLENLIEAQERILDAEKANIPYMEALIDEKNLLVSKKEEVIPYIENKADARIELANKKEEISPYLSDKATANTDLANKKDELLINIEEKLDAQIELSNKKEELLINIEERIDAQVALIDKKAELLPFIEDKAYTQEQLAFKKEELFPDILDKVDSIKVVANKREELLPYMQAKSTALIKLAAALVTHIEFKKDMLGIEKEKIGLKTDIVDNEVDILDAQILVEDMRKLLIEQKHDLQEDMLDKEKEFTITDTENLGLIAEQKAITLTQLQNDKIDVRSDREDTEGKILDAEILKTEVLKHEHITEDKALIRREKVARVADIKESANASATADITSKLIHLIGS